MSLDEISHMAALIAQNCDRILRELAKPESDHESFSYIEGLCRINKELTFDIRRRC